jgi:hypothetical protein
MRGSIQELVDGEWIILPCVTPELPGGWPPSDRSRKGWTDHFVRRLDRDGNLDAIRQAVQWEWREEHPYVQQFVTDALEAALSRKPEISRPDVDAWTREDFIREIERDKEDGGRGGRRSVGTRHFVSPSKLYRRWQAVSPGEPLAFGGERTAEP